MPASITFDDGAGAQTITPSPSVSRFNRWQPTPDTIGERANAVADGRLYQWTHRTDFGASFELPHLANSGEAVLQAFLLWANAGGAFTVTTGDSESNVYTEVQVAPGTRAELSDPDPETIEYTLSLTVINVATTPVPLRCVYS